MEVVEHSQRENCDMPCLHLLAQICVNEIYLLIGKVISTIAGGSLFLLIVLVSWKGNQDVILRCMAD